MEAGRVDVSCERCFFFPTRYKPVLTSLHVTGIWLTPSLSSTVRVPLNGSPLADPNNIDIQYGFSYPKTPFLTLIGSSNYGLRSAQRDIEANLLITTFSPELRGDLQGEIRAIREYATDLVGENLFKRKERVVSKGVKIASKVIENML